MIERNSDGTFKSGKHHPNYKKGLYTENYYCKICHQSLSNPYSTLCRECYLEEMRNKKPWNFLGGKQRFPDCKVCGKKLSRPDAKLCREHRDENQKGEQRPKHSLIMKELWLDEKYRNKVLKDVKPNKPEKLFIELLNGTNFKYVGNYKFWIDRFNPDFIDKSNKKIIEIYGDYWHTGRTNYDEERISSYTKNGYRTLIIWTHELKDLNLIKNKIYNFIKEGV
jgi:very-short-patch-repair endonuclease